MGDFSKNVLQTDFERKKGGMGDFTDLVCIGKKFFPTPL